MNKIRSYTSYEEYKEKDQRTTELKKKNVQRRNNKPTYWFVSDDRKKETASTEIGIACQVKSLTRK